MEDATTSFDPRDNAWPAMSTAKEIADGFSQLDQEQRRSMRALAGALKFIAAQKGEGIGFGFLVIREADALLQMK